MQGHGIFEVREYYINDEGHWVESGQFGTTGSVVASGGNCKVIRYNSALF
jgi:hypothetical protein